MMLNTAIAFILILFAIVLYGLFVVERSTVIKYEKQILIALLAMLLCSLFMALDMKIN